MAYEKRQPKCRVYLPQVFKLSQICCFLCLCHCNLNILAVLGDVVRTKQRIKKDISSQKAKKDCSLDWKCLKILWIAWKLHLFSNQDYKTLKILAFTTLEGETISRTWWLFDVQPALYASPCNLGTFYGHYVDHEPLRKEQVYLKWLKIRPK